MLDSRRNRNPWGFIDTCSIVPGAHERLQRAQESRLRARELEHFLREIELFILNHGYDVGDKWDDQINGFRLSLEKILGNHPRSFTTDQDSDIDTGEEKGERNVGRIASSSGNG